MIAFFYVFLTSMFCNVGLGIDMVDESSVVIVVAVIEHHL